MYMSLKLKQPDLQQINRTLAVSIAKVDVLAPVTACSNVIQPAGEFDS